MKDIISAAQAVLDTKQSGHEPHLVSVDALALDAIKDAISNYRSFAYLGAPYSHDDFAVREMRFQQISVAAAHLMNQGEIVFSPISHSHPLAVYGTLPTDWGFWQRFDRLFLGLCEKLIVLKLPGWETSAGLLRETFIASELGKPIVYKQPAECGLKMDGKAVANG